METANWIADVNRFGLPEPPPWALVKLKAFDPMLVIIPSRFEKQYLLTRRRQYSAGLGDVAMLDNQHPDTNMMVTHHLLPILPIVSKSGAFLWEQGSLNAILAQLKAADTWAISGGPDGNPDLIWQHVEAEEDRAKALRRANLRDDFKHRGHDAWRSIKARTGQRNRRASDFHGAARRTAKGRTLQ